MPCFSLIKMILPDEWIELIAIYRAARASIPKEHIPLFASNCTSHFTTGEILSLIFPLQPQVLLLTLESRFFVTTELKSRFLPLFWSHPAVLIGGIVCPFVCIWCRFRKWTCAKIATLCVISHLFWWNSAKTAHRFNTPSLFLLKNLASYTWMWAGKLHQHLIEHFPQARVNSSLGSKISLFSTFLAAYAALPVPLTQSLINFMKFEFQSWKWTRDPAMVQQQNERPRGA